jgi:hypothetical protein
MFRDSFLMPAEALRLAALGMLGEAPRRYGELANEVGLFASRIAGPSLELMGTSVELLRYERLIETDTGAIEDNPLLRLTPGGREMLLALLRAPLKAPGSQFNRLFLALKLRFLHFLPEAEQLKQIGLVAEWYRGEAGRLAELRCHPAANSPLFLTWLDQEATQIEARLAWLASAGAAVMAGTPD